MNSTNELAHGWMSSPDGRGTIDIIWSCGVTVILCSWSVLFLNVPSESGRRAFLRTKFAWVAFTILFPEILAAIAQQQWISACHSVSELSKPGQSGWSIRHGFFADMGGFVLKSKDYVEFPIDAHQISYLVSQKYMKFPNVEKKAIWDKNKADGFARLLTLVQVCWFALQCLGRAFQHLPISTFELSTLAFILCTLPTFFWWRHKPLDVATTISIPLNEDVKIEDILRLAGDSARAPFKSTPLDFINPEPHKWDFLGPPMWGFNLLFGVAGDPKSGPIRTFRNSARNIAKSVGILDWAIISVVSTGYVCLHLIGWNFLFPTTVERWLWRAAALTLLGSVVSYGLLYLIFTWQMPFVRRCFGVSEADTVMELITRLPRVLQYMIAISWIGSYTVARLYLIAEAFVGLRALPLAVYDTVQWSNFIPHI